MVKSLDTEQKIIAAAREVFLQKGKAGARMQQIADEAGINKALLHYYFRSKDKLFEKIFTEELKKISAGLMELTKEELPVLEKIKRFVDVYWEVISRNPYLPNFVLNEINNNPEHMENLLGADVIPGMVGFFEQLMKEANNGLIRPVHPAHLIINIMGMVLMSFLAKPVLTPILKKQFNINYNSILEQRKDFIYEFIYNALKLPEA